MRPTLLLLFLGCAACQQSAPEQAAPAAPLAPRPTPALAPAPPKTDGFLDSAWFTIAKLDTFAVDGTGEKLLRLTPAQEKQFLQRTARSYNQYTPSYFYSLQENTPNRQEITVLTYDGEYMSNLWRLVYDARHRLISRQKVAGYGADGEQHTSVTGLFETPARFRLTSLDKWSADDSTFTRYDVDSTVTYYVVAQEEFRQLRQRTYKRQYTRPLSPQ